MSAAFVVDCSVAMTWLFADEATAQTGQLLRRLAEESALVPAFWFIEVTNVMALAERKRRITPVQSDAFIVYLGKLDIQSDLEGPSRAFQHVLPLCRAYQLTSYDALYLDLALRQNLPLATLDEPLRKAAKKLGLGLLGK
jgi:predicted nucleic acid-binding protein